MTAADDFANGPLKDFGIAVTRTPVTVAKDNISGQKTYADGSTNSMTVVMKNPNLRHALDKSGLTETADAIMYTIATQTLNKYDKVLWNSKTYRVTNISMRKFAGVNAYKRVELFLVS